MITGRYSLQKPWDHATLLASAMTRHEDAAGSLRANRAINHFAGIGWLKLDTSITALVAVRMTLVRDRLLRYFRSRRGRVRLRAEDHRGASCARRTQHRAARKWCRPASRLVCHSSLS